MNINFTGYGKGLVALGAVAVLAVLSSWFNKTEGTPAPASTTPAAVTPIAVDDTPGCIAQGVDTAPPTFASTPDPRGIASRHVFDRLVEYDRRSGKIVPGLATRWEVSDDRRAYTFYLRQNVVFHTLPDFSPRRYFNADDVLFTFGRLLNDRNPFHNLPAHPQKDFKATGLADLVESISRDDPYRITFNLTVPYPKFLANLSMDYASVLSAEQAEQAKARGKLETFAAWPSGTGAFAVASMDAGQIHYTPNLRYWADVIPDAATRPVEKQIVPPAITGVD